MKLSQERQIYNYLRNGGTLTRRQADRKFDCCKLPARISGIKKDQERGIYPADFLIITKMFQSKTKKNLAEYEMLRYVNRKLVPCYPEA